MAKQTFVNKIVAVEKKALDYILSVLKKRGTNYEIVDPASYEDGIEDEVYELPRGIHVTKHGFYEEYPIVVINIDNEDKLTFVGLACIGETDDDRTFEVDDLSAPCICAIADIVARLEN